MTKPSRAISVNTRRKRDSSPSGARFYTTKRGPISETFIKSLRKDGISRDTIHEIRRDNKKRVASSADADDAS